MENPSRAIKGGWYKGIYIGDRPKGKGGRALGAETSDQEEAQAFYTYLATRGRRPTLFKFTVPSQRDRYAVYWRPEDIGFFLAAHPEAAILNPFRSRRFPFIGPRRPKVENNPEYAYGPTGFRPPSAWFTKMLKRVAAQYPKEKVESKGAYRQALSRIVGGIWARFDDATRLKILQKYEPSANPLATLSSALVTGAGFGAGLIVGKKVLEKVWKNPEDKMEAQFRKYDILKSEMEEISALIAAGRIPLESGMATFRKLSSKEKEVFDKMDSLARIRKSRKKRNVLNLDEIETQATSGTLVRKGWREHKTHQAETQAVKNALIEAGYTNVKVKHGTGTAWGWLKIYADPKPGQSYQDKRLGILRIAKRITGRGGDYEGEINVF